MTRIVKHGDRRSSTRARGGCVPPRMTEIERQAREYVRMVRAGDLDRSEIEAQARGGSQAAVEAVAILDADARYGGQR